MSKPVIVLGSGGHASVLVDMLRQMQRELLGVVSPDAPGNRRVFSDITHYPDDEKILSFAPDTLSLVNGIGSLPGNQLRAELFNRFKAFGYQFETVVSPHAVVSPYAELGEGVQVMPGAIINAGAKIGDNSIINTAAVIEHDCSIGVNNHIAPGVTLSGEVHTGNQVHIATGACVIQGIEIGSGAIVAAGTVVYKNVPNHHIARGPAKEIIPIHKHP